MEKEKEKEEEEKEEEKLLLAVVVAGAGQKEAFEGLRRGVEGMAQAVEALKAEGGPEAAVGFLQAEVNRAREEIAGILKQAELQLSLMSCRNISGNLFAQIPQAPHDGFALRVWIELRELALSTRRKHSISVGSDRKKRHVVHHLAEEFGFAHLGNEKITIFKRDGYELVFPDPPQNMDADEARYFDIIKRFCTDSRKKTLNFPSSLDRSQREKVHRLAEMFGGYLDHDTFGSQTERYIRLTKVDPARRVEQKERLKAIEAAILSDRVNESATAAPSETPEASSPRPPRITPPPFGLGTEDGGVGGGIRLVQWNIAWMDLILEDDRKCWSVARVILELQPDLLAVQEGPSSVARMEEYVKKYLGDKYLVFGGLEELRQQLFFLVRRDGALKEVSIHEPTLVALSEPWQFDIAGDFSLPNYKFTRRPLVIRGKWGDRDLFACTMHMKSKKVSHSVKVTEDFVVKSVKSRRRLGAECFRLREVLEETILTPFPDAGLVVLGDLNTGPGRDFFARFFLLFDSVDVLLGSPFEHTKRLYAPLMEQRGEYELRTDELWSAEFTDFFDRKKKRVMIDHIFVSRVMKRLEYRAGIAHDIVRPSSSELSPSDHVPVWMDVRAKGVQ